ncbi:hypothetical protein [Streptomyces sp. NPDC046805]|uniref:hypothetical protein n=1 Tax=Streptomyces sp. NPDC046805 TaxID=3155134 RepID=UPI0033DD505D
MIDSVVRDAQKLFRVTPDLVPVVTEGQGPRVLHEPVVRHITGDEAAYAVFRQVCTFVSPYGQSWLHQPGAEEPYLSLELARDALNADRYRSLLTEIVLSDSVSLPYDYRALAARELVRVGTNAFTDLVAAVEGTYVAKPRTVDSKLASLTDGIDHVFEIPQTVEERLALLRAATGIKMRESRALLAGRVLRACGAPAEALAAVDAFEAAVRPAEESLTSAEAERLIAEDADNALVSPEDYLVGWDQELAVPGPGSAPLTLAELLRITLLAPEFKLPDATVRPALVDFYRAALRVSGRVVVGLGSGVFYVEHGADAHPSYFYAGRDAVLGKGCTIDGVGGVVLQQGCFLGGGFVPVLIHTHKHIRKSGEPGVAERKQVLPVVFAAQAGSRLPMQHVGIFETADFLDGEPSPYAGIRAIALDK